MSMSNINKLSLINEGPASSRTYKLSLSSCIGVYTIEWNFNPNNELSSAIPCRIQIKSENGSILSSTGFSGDSSYDQQLSDLGFSATTSNQSNGLLNYNKTDENVSHILLTIDSPIPGSKWQFTLRCPDTCDSDSDDKGLCGIPIYVYGPKTISCGSELLLGGTRSLINCDDVTVVHGPEGDSDYCLNCLSNEVSVSVVCGTQDDSDSDSDSDSDVGVGVLFDKSSWSDIPAPYKEYLDEAADRWNDLIKINNNVFAEAISVAAQASEPNWKGIKLANQDAVAALGDSNRPFNFELTNDVDYVASCGPVSFFDISTVSNNGYTGSVSKPHISLNFTLKVSTHYSSQGDSPISREKWISVMTHELGHALGFGIFWKAFGDNPKSLLGEDPPVDNYLDGTIFVNAQAAYNQIVSDPSLVKIPLENDPSSLSQDLHWEDEVRMGDGLYPGLLDEIMVSNIKQDYLTISRLSIGALKDIGYEEVLPGSHEGAPNTISQ
jgi:hypothetical protein